MPETKTPEAPGADTAASPVPTPARSRRYSFYPDGKDYVLLSVQRDAEGNPIPNGALAAIPEVPRFESAQEAKRWINASGEQLAGTVVLVVRMMHKLSINVTTKPTITIAEDDRFKREMEESPIADAENPAPSGEPA